MTRFKRKQTIKKADAILAADIHLRSNKPTCRTDDFFTAMNNKIDFLLALSKEHSCPILVSGDLGNNSQWSNELLEWTISKFEGHNIICIPGQHDLPNHQISQFEKSGMGVLTAAEAIQTIWEPYVVNNKFTVHPFPYSSEMKNRKSTAGLSPHIAITHQMVIENRKLWPGQEAPEGHALLKQFPEYSLILSGDNHIPFVSEYKGRLLVNPGSMMRTTAAQENHKPRVYLWYAEENKVEAVCLPIEQNVISRGHIDIAEERSDRMDAYLERMKHDVEIELSFETNIESYLAKYRTQLPIKEKVYGAMEE